MSAYAAYTDDSDAREAGRTALTALDRLIDDDGRVVRFDETATDGAEETTGTTGEARSTPETTGTTDEPESTSATTGEADLLSAAGWVVRACTTARRLLGGEK